MVEERDENRDEGNTSVEEQATGKEPSESVPTEDWQKKYQELHDQYVRLAADFDNFRKRHHAEVDAARKYGVENTLHSVIPVLDNLDRATTSLSENSEPKILFQSFRLMYNQLLDAFAALGLKKMETVGKPFDPQFHEAVSQVETTEHPDQTVVSELQGGFMMQDNVIRPAMVAVAVNPGGEAAQPESQQNPFKQTTEGQAFNPGNEA